MTGTVRSLHDTAVNKTHEQHFGGTALSRVLSGPEESFSKQFLDNYYSMMRQLHKQNSFVPEVSISYSSLGI
jgi:hypothetical protein